MRFSPSPLALALFLLLSSSPATAKTPGTYAEGQEICHTCNPTSEGKIIKKCNKCEGTSCCNFRNDMWNLKQLCPSGTVARPICNVGDGNFSSSFPLPLNSSQGFLSDFSELVVADTIPGVTTLTDTGSGTVTLSDLDLAFCNAGTTDAIVAYGPGAFIFVEEASRLRVDGTHVASGSTAASGSVAWGVVSGWSATGDVFCRSSPDVICSSFGFVHGSTIPASPLSPTYDLGTWTFDASGSYEATPYIWATLSGGVGNSQAVLRGKFVRRVPALPAVGGACLAIVLAGLGRKLLAERPVGSTAPRP